MNRTSSCYFVSGNTQTWSAARQWCQAHDSDLAIINSQNEFNFIIQLTRIENKYYWVITFHENTGS